MKFTEGRKILAESAGRPLGSVLSKMKLFRSCFFLHLHKSLVDWVLFYNAAGVWMGFWL